MFTVALLCGLISCVFADWPPTHCPRPVYVKSGYVVMTDGRINNRETTCGFKETFKKNIYIKYRRTSTSRLHGTADSTLSFVFTENNINKFTLEVHNDKLLLLTESKDIISSKSKCMAVFNRRDDEFQWIRLRINHLYEIDRTFISLDYTSYEGNQFHRCLRFELPIFSELTVGAKAYTSAGMRQEVHTLTKIAPTLYDTNNKYESLKVRIGAVENSMDKIRQTLRVYMTQHDVHVTKTSSKHKNMQDMLINHKNTINSKSTSQFLVWIFIFLATGIGVCFFIHWKFKKQRKWGHLM